MAKGVWWLSAKMYRSHRTARLTNPNLWEERKDENSSIQPNLGKDYTEFLKYIKKVIYKKNK